MSERMRVLEPLRLALLMLFFTTPLLIYLPSFESVVLPKTVFVVVMTALLLAILVLLPTKRHGGELLAPTRMDEIRTPLDLPVLATVVAVVLSLWFAGQTATSSLAFRLLLNAVVLVYLLTYLFRHHPDWVASLRYALTVSGVLVAGYVILQDYQLDPLPWAGGVPDWRGRLPGTMGSPDAVAGFEAAILPTLVMQFWRAASPVSGVLWGAGLLVVLMALVVTFSVGAWLGILFAGLLALWILRRPSYQPMSWWVWITAVAALVGLFLFVEASEGRSFMMNPLRTVTSLAPLSKGGRGMSVGNVLLPVIFMALMLTGLWLAHRRLHIAWAKLATVALLWFLVVAFYFTANPWNGRPGSLWDQAQASDRWKTGAGARRFIWKTTALMVKDDPVFGIGFGRYFKIHATYQGRLYTLRGRPHDRPTVGRVPQVHNEYFQQMTETGIIGSVPFFWLVLAIIALWPVAYNRSPEGERGWMLAAILGLAILMVNALTTFPFRRPEAWLAGGFFLAQIVARSAKGPCRRTTEVVTTTVGGTTEVVPAAPGESAQESGSIFSPAVRVVILVGLFFQVAGFVRPLVSNIYLQRSTEAFRSPAERWGSLQKAIAWNPKDFTAHLMMALELLQQGRYEDAVQEARAALRVREDLEARQLIANAYLAAGRYSESARAWEDVLRINPMFPPFLAEAARRYELAGDRQRTEDYLQQARELGYHPLP